MTLPFAPRRLAIAAFAAAMSALLAACFVLPGKFAETLDLRKDGHFSYSYKGEIVVLGLTKLMDMANAAGNKIGEEFVPTTCYGTKTGRERACAKAELAKQKADWDADADTRKAAKTKRDQETQTVMGGLDPNDPKSGEELAVRLRKQVGWKSVTYKGDGVYEIDFQISGTLTHDFSFPTIEKLPAVLPFLVVNLRSDGSVRVSSPLMDQSNGGGGNAMGFGAMAAMFGEEQAAKDDQNSETKAVDNPKAPPFPIPNGTFTLTTDGAILANNTDDGPQADPTGKRLVWKINVRNSAAPTALVQLGK